MKLAEALMMRSDLQVRLEKLKQRVVNNVKIQEGDEVDESPDLLIDEIEEVIAKINELVKQINKTNMKATLEDGRSLTEALADREAIMLKRSTLEKILEAAVIKRDRYTRSEIKYINTVNVRILQKKCDDLSSQFRVLDTKIQEKNWLTDLI